MILGAAAAAQTDERKAWVNEMPRKVLIIEDESNIAELLHLYLE